METTDELGAFLATATEEGARGDLLNRGQASSLMRTNGVLPANAPNFGATIETDLAEHGFSLLQAAIALRTQAGPSDVTNNAFERAATCFEALVCNGDPESSNRGFRRTIAAMAYHLAGFSAVAYSIFNESAADANLAPGEVALRHLVLRDLTGLRGFVREWLSDDAHSDEQMARELGGRDADADVVLATILNTTICRALAFFDFALETGEQEPLEATRKLLSTAVGLADNAENVPLWWISRLCLHLVNDLWEHSLHENFPTEPPEGAAQTYPELKRLYIGSLYARDTAEVELWPSQREAARRAMDVEDDLVLSLPTSAGKTRVAEIAALITLSLARRVLIVTPLRALSAQTERSFRQMFGPIGFGVSSLYGASGLQAADEDALRSQEIVVATPEKLDFALRSDPSLIDDVGLIVLDEGHMIGPREREIRYETLVQRLLLRSDAAERRIVCLSAILPSGDELNDLTAWIRADVPGDAVRSDWRPTRQRYGTLAWNGTDARLTLDLDTGVPFLDRFVLAKRPIGQETTPRPRDNRELALFAAWRFAAQGKTTLIFLTQANWVEGYGKLVVDLCNRAYLNSLLDDDAAIAQAQAVGREWLGADHPAVASLKAGVAIHHASLPRPFLRELETLLPKGVFKVVIASPTLSQGLNLHAAVLLVPVLHRSGNPIAGGELENVAGRAGRAFVDTEGLIVHTMFDRIDWRTKTWRELAQSSRARTLKSGWIKIVAKILMRLTHNGGLERGDAWEYLANSRDAWKSEMNGAASAAQPSAARDASAGDARGSEHEEATLAELVELLDTAVFGLIEALDSERADLPKLLDEALKGSLWARQIEREGDGVRAQQRMVFKARANLIWSVTTPQARKGHFAMGVGLEAGLTIDEMAEELNELVDRADDASLAGDADELSEALVGLAERLLVMRPFIPRSKNGLPADWRDVLKQWVSGVEVTVIGEKGMKVVEEAFAYQLAWALEAIRVRRMTLGWSPETITGGAAAALETGVPQFMMSMLIRAGLPSRRAAIIAIKSAKPVFVTTDDMRTWLESGDVADATASGDWPTLDTAAQWARFRAEALRDDIQKWSVERKRRRLDVSSESAPPAGLYRIVGDKGDGRTWLMTADYRRIAPFKKPVIGLSPGLVSGRCQGGECLVDVLRVGPGQMRWRKADV